MAVRLSGEVTALVGYGGDGDAFFGTYDYTQATALASFGIDNNLSSHS
jgi:hypothetical protein